MYSLKRIFAVCKRFDECDKYFLKNSSKLFKCGLMTEVRECFLSMSEIAILIQWNADSFEVKVNYLV